MRLRNCLGMIWSVSTSARSSGQTMPVTFRNGSMSVPLRPRVELAHVHQVTRDRGGRGHLRADQMRAPALALPPLEVAVGGRGAALLRLEDVGVHSQAHRAAGV